MLKIKSFILALLISAFALFTACDDDDKPEEEPASGDKFIVYDATAGANRAVEYQYINPSLTYTNGTFTGDGSTTTITIDSGRAVNDVMVSQNGFLLVPTERFIAFFIFTNRQGLRLLVYFAPPLISPLCCFNLFLRFVVIPQ